MEGVLGLSHEELLTEIKGLQEVGLLKAHDGWYVPDFFVANREDAEAAYAHARETGRCWVGPHSGPAQGDPTPATTSGLLRATRSTWAVTERTAWSHDDADNSLIPDQIPGPPTVPVRPCVRAIRDDQAICCGLNSLGGNNLLSIPHPLVQEELTDLGHVPGTKSQISGGQRNGRRYPLPPVISDAEGQKEVCRGELVEELARGSPLSLSFSESQSGSSPFGTLQPTVISRRAPHVVIRRSPAALSGHRSAGGVIAHTAPGS